MSGKSLQARGITHQDCKGCGVSVRVEDFPVGGGGGKTRFCVDCYKARRRAQHHRRKAGLAEPPAWKRAVPPPKQEVCWVAARFLMMPRPPIRLDDAP